MRSGWIFQQNLSLLQNQLKSENLKLFWKISKINLWAARIVLICSEMKKACPNDVSMMLSWLENFWGETNFSTFWNFFMLFFIKVFLCIIPLRAFLMLEIPWLFKQKMNFKKFSIGRMKNLTAVPYSNMGSKNSFSLSFWALKRYLRKKLWSADS